MASMLTLWVAPYFHSSSRIRPRNVDRILCTLRSGESSVLPSESLKLNGAPVGEKEKMVSATDARNGYVGAIVGQEKLGEEAAIPEELEVLWDDGFGIAGMKDYLDIVKEVIKPDGGPPRWFCPVECGRPLKDSPVLLFLPGIDGTGLGLLMHHKPLGKVFEVRCLHIPVNDRTPFEELVKFVEQTVRNEHASSPNKPIYLVGDSFGGCLALAVAARNSSIDLVVILANPATSLNRSQLQPLFPLLEDLPGELPDTFPYLLSFIMGEPLKMAMTNIDPFPPAQMLLKLSENLTALLPRLSVISDIIPKETLVWKLKVLKSAAAYTNSRLHAVKAEVLVLASGKDNMLPSVDEGKRLLSLLKKCKLRVFKENGHALLLEDSLSLLTIIKGTRRYRRSKRLDYISDFIPPSMSEFNRAFGRTYGFLRTAVSPVMFSTLKDGKIVRGLDGVPIEGPVLYVGYHMLMGLEVVSLIDTFLKEKKIMLRGLGHPQLFSQASEDQTSEFSVFDNIRLFGAVPVSPTALFKLLSKKSHVLLYPGGAREALHRKGEAYKLFWPDEQEFVRVAARFGATIVPFGAVGEDDLLELILDYNDLMRIPVLNEAIRESNRNMASARGNKNGEVANDDLFLPGILPKPPGRFYYHFGQPIETKGKEDILRDKGNASELYLQIKSQVESSLAYLLKKREEDPCRNIVDRTMYQLYASPLDDVPTFSP